MCINVINDCIVAGICGIITSKAKKWCIGTGVSHVWEGNGTENMRATISGRRINFLLLLDSN